MSFSKHFEEIINSLFAEMHTENSPAFREYLKKSKLEENKIKIPFYPCNLDTFLGLTNKELITKHYSFVDKAMFLQVKNILKTPKEASEISSILKRTQYKVLIAKLDTLPRERISSLFKSLEDFSNFFSEDFIELKIFTNKKNVLFKTTNPEFLSIVKKSFWDVFTEKPLQEINSDLIITPEFLSTPDISGIYIDLAAIEILHYLNVNSKKLKADINNFYLNKYSNKDLKTTFHLLEAAKLIDEKGRINSNEKDYLRSRLKRYNNKISTSKYKLQTEKEVKKLGIKKGDDFSLLLERFISKTLEIK